MWPAMWFFLQIIIVGAFVLFGSIHAEWTAPGDLSAARGGKVIWSLIGIGVAWLVTYLLGRSRKRQKAEQSPDHPESSCPRHRLTFEAHAPSETPSRQPLRD